MVIFVNMRCFKPIFHCDTKYLASGVGPRQCLGCWRYQHVGIFWRYLTLKFALAPTPNPDASQWNIGGVGSSAIGAGVGHVHFMFFVLISFAFVANTNAFSSGIFHYVCAAWNRLPLNCSIIEGLN